jgi:hypothetical protein
MRAALKGSLDPRTTPRKSGPTYGVRPLLMEDFDGSRISGHPTP